jgi:acyl carrier protein
MLASSAFDAGYAAGFVLGGFLMLALFAFGIISVIMAIVRRTKGWVITAVVFALIGIGGVVAAVVLGAVGMRKTLAEQAKQKTVTSDDGWVSVSIPGSWTLLPELPGEAALKAGNKFREEYAIVISESKADIDGTLDDFAHAAITAIRGNLDSAGEVSPIENSTAGTFPARRCRLAGKVGNIRIAYLHFSIETPEGFHQLMMWTLPSKESRAWPVFERVAQSFAVVKPPPPESPAAKAARTQPAPPRVPRTGTIEERLRAIFVEQLGVTKEKLTPEARIKEDLGADELDSVELVMAAEEEFDIEIADQDAEKLTTFAAFVEYVTARAKK